MYFLPDMQERRSMVFDFFPSKKTKELEEKKKKDLNLGFWICGRNQEFALIPICGRTGWGKARVLKIEEEIRVCGVIGDKLIYGLKKLG